MAKYITGTVVGPGALDAFVLVLRTHLLANGWTEHDVRNSTPGSRDIVFKGTALDATADNAPFLRITQSSTTQAYFRTYSDWDATAHAGMAEAGAAGYYFTGADAGFAYFVRANGSGLGITTKVSSTYYKAYGGFLARLIPPTMRGVAKTTQGYAIGATVLNVASDMTGKLQVGQRVHVQNFAHNNASANKENAEVVTITALSATQITVTALTKAYDSGALIGWIPMPAIAGGASTAALPSQYFFCTYNLDGTRTNATSQQYNPTANYDGPTLTVATPAGDQTVGWFVGSQNTAPKAGYYGVPYHFYAVTINGITPSMEDTFTPHDGSGKTFIYVGTNIMMGPRED